MNKRIKKLAEQAGITTKPLSRTIFAKEITIVLIREVVMISTCKIINSCEPECQDALLFLRIL